MELELKMMGDNPVTSWKKAVYSPDKLSGEDRAILDRYFNYGIIQIKRLEEMRGYGLAEKDLSQRISYLGWQFGNEAGRRWWAGSRKDHAPEFAKKVDDILAAENGEMNRKTLDSMLPPKEDAI